MQTTFFSTTAAAAAFFAVTLISPAISVGDETAEHRKLAAVFLSLNGMNEAEFRKLVDGVRAASKPQAGAKPSGSPAELRWSDVEPAYVDAIMAEIPLEPLQAFQSFSQTAAGRKLSAKLLDLLNQGVGPTMARAYGVDPAVMQAATGTAAKSAVGDASRRAAATKLLDVLAAAGVAAAFREYLQGELRTAEAYGAVTTLHLVGSPEVAGKMLEDSRAQLAKRMRLVDADLQSKERREATIGIVATAFTPDELRDISAFVRTPQGDAFARRMLPAKKSVGRLVHADLLRATGIDRQGVEKFMALTKPDLPTIKAEPGDEIALAIEEARGKALALANAGKRDEAITLYDKALEMAVKHHGPRHVETARVLGDLALQHFMLDRLAKAESLQSRRLEILEQAAGKDSLEVAECLDDIALLRLRANQAGGGAPLLERALAIREKLFGNESPRLAGTLDRLSGLYRILGQRDREERTLLRSLTIRERELGRDHPDLPQTLGRLAQHYQDRGLFEKAEPILLRALAIREQHAAPEKTDFSWKQVAWSLGDLVDFYKAAGRPEKAEPLERRRFEILEQVGDEAEIARSKGMRLYFAGDFAAALPPLERHLELSRKQWGETSTLTADDHYWVGEVFRHLRRSKDAAGHFDTWRHVMRRHAGDVLPMLTQIEQVTFMQDDRARLDDALSLALDAPDDGQIADLAAAWLLNSKAIVLDSLATRTLLLRGAKDDKSATLTAELLAVRKELAALAYESTATPADADRARSIEQLTTREQELSRSLGVVSIWAQKADPWVPTAQVRQALPEGAVLVEIARIDYAQIAADGKEGKSEDRYVAWVIPKNPGVPVRAIDLGSAFEIDVAATQVRAEIGKAPERFRAVGEQEAEKALNARVRTLAARILDPILAHVGTATKILLAPDGDLWLVPWGALTLPDGRYAIEAYDIRYLNTGRDLVATRAAGLPKASAAVVIADPDFDLSAASARAQTQKLAPTGRPAGLRSVPQPDSERGLAQPLALPRVARLPFTATEARLIGPGLGRYAGGPPRVLLDKDALETAFKTLKNPRAIVLSTHGYFQPPPARGASAAVANPLLRCGILLAGCNDRAAREATDDDGILTGLEIVGTDLRGTDLVVLSACQTGEGQVNVGEGVAGLRQAFQLAGARAVVATLWQVPDRQTAELMQAFFDDLPAADDPAAALRRAQLAMIAGRRAATGAAHPLFWAAFTHTGNPRTRP